MKIVPFDPRDYPFIEYNEEALTLAKRGQLTQADLSMRLAECRIETRFFARLLEWLDPNRQKTSLNRSALLDLQDLAREQLGIWSARKNCFDKYHVRERSSRPHYIIACLVTSNILTAAALAVLWWKGF